MKIPFDYNHVFISFIWLASSLLLSGYIAHIFIQWRKKPSLKLASSQIYSDINSSYAIAKSIVAAIQVEPEFYFPTLTFDVTFKYLVENGRLLDNEMYELSAFQHLSKIHNEYLEFYFKNYSTTSDNQNQHLNKFKTTAKAMIELYENYLGIYAKYRINAPEFSYFYDQYVKYQTSKEINRKSGDLAGKLGLE